MKKNNVVHCKGVCGYPYQVIWPNKKFTFRDLQIANGIDPQTGRGQTCTTLTLYKALKKSLKSENPPVYLLGDQKAEPQGEGRGRKALVYCSRSIMNLLKHARSKKVTVDFAEPTSEPVPVSPAIESPELATV